MTDLEKEVEKMLAKADGNIARNNEEVKSNPYAYLVDKSYIPILVKFNGFNGRTKRLVDLYQSKLGDNAHFFILDEGSGDLVQSVVLAFFEENKQAESFKEDLMSLYSTIIREKLVYSLAYLTLNGFLARRAIQRYYNK